MKKNVGICLFKQTVKYSNNEYFIILCVYIYHKSVFYLHNKDRLKGKHMNATQKRIKINTSFLYNNKSGNQRLLLGPVFSHHQTQKVRKKHT